MIPAGYAEPRVVCTVADARITEASGLVASDLQPGVLFTHNDSGDSARFFALDTDCRDRGTFQLRGVRARDWEDIARGPGHVLWLGDIGDNSARRTSIRVHRVAEPRATSGTVTVSSSGFELRYPDGPHDAETLLADPLDGRLYLITKNRDGHDRLYAAPLPLSASAVNTMTALDAVTVPGFLPLTTAGDISPDGFRLVLRTYTNAWELPLPPLVAGRPRLAGAFARGLGTPVTVDATRQGESIAYSSDGRSLYTLPEGKEPPLTVLSPTTVASPAPRRVRNRSATPYLLVGVLALLAVLVLSRRARPGS
ncbi:MAG: hypothetical protein JWO12_1858 [Frankiales bacterium]|nr:hypothetical protein [Frankiales bacterium]